MKAKAYDIYCIPEFRDGYCQQTEKARVQIDDRLSKIQDSGYFGDYKSVSEGNPEIWELKWRSGRRIYFAFIPENKILLLLGGNKNGQNKEIGNAKGFVKKYTN